MDSLIWIVAGAGLLLLVGAWLFFRRSGASTLPPPAASPALSKKPLKAPAGAPLLQADPQATPSPQAAAPASGATPIATTTSKPKAAVSLAPAAVSVPAPEEVHALRRGLESTRKGFVARLARLLGAGAKIDESLLKELEETLLTADVGVATAELLIERLRARVKRGDLGNPDRVWAALREEALAILLQAKVPAWGESQPHGIVVVGVNGAGKTTTIGKLAQRYRSEGKSVVLGAGDTFRAAAVLQLEVWAKRAQVPVVKGKEKSDSAAVIFEALQKGRTESADVVICDTAGRLHTKTSLMDELKKVLRTGEKALERPVDDIWLVIDATTGQNALAQASAFAEALPITGIVLTKLDGTAKGGIVLAVVAALKAPIRFIGVGERLEDLREFDAPSFVAALFSKPEEREDLQN